jgi:hypothetical protein
MVSCPLLSTNLPARVGRARSSGDKVPRPVKEPFAGTRKSAEKTSDRRVFKVREKAGGQRWKVQDAPGPAGKEENYCYF